MSTSLLGILGGRSYINLYSSCCRIPSTEFPVGGNRSQLDLRWKRQQWHNEHQPYLGARVLSTYEAARIISSSAEK